VVEVLAQYVVFAPGGAVEGEVEEAAGGQDPSHMGQALVDDRQRRVGEDTVRMHHVEVGVRQEIQGQVPHQGEVGQLVLQFLLDEGSLGGEQDVGGDVDPV